MLISQLSEIVVFLSLFVFRFCGRFRVLPSLVSRGQRGRRLRHFRCIM